jgi:hypothetical protein
MTATSHWRRLTVGVAFSLSILTLASSSDAAVKTYPGLFGIRVTEISGGPFFIPFLPNLPPLNTQLAVLNAGSNDFAGAPSEFYDFFFSDANGAFNPNGNYFTAEAVFTGQSGGGLNIAAVDLLLGSPQNPTFCRADVLASWVGLGSNYVAGSEVFAVDPDLPIASTFTVMGNTAGVPGRLRVTVGWSKIVPEPTSTSLAACGLATLGRLARRRSKGGRRA